MGRVATREESAAVLEKVKRLLETDNIMQEKIKTCACATVGELLDVDEIIGKAFSYQDKAAKKQ